MNYLFSNQSTVTLKKKNMLQYLNTYLLNTLYIKQFYIVIIYILLLLLLLYIIFPLFQSIYITLYAQCLISF